MTDPLQTPDASDIGPESRPDTSRRRDKPNPARRFAWYCTLCWAVYAGLWFSYAWAGRKPWGANIGVLFWPLVLLGYGITVGTGLVAGLLVMRSVERTALGAGQGILVAWLASLVGAFVPFLIVVGIAYTCLGMFIWLFPAGLVPLLLGTLNAVGFSLGILLVCARGRSRGGAAIPPGDRFEGPT